MISKYDFENLGPEPPPSPLKKPSIERPEGRVTAKGF